MFPQTDEMVAAPDLEMANTMWCSEPSSLKTELGTVAECGMLYEVFSEHQSSPMELLLFVTG